MHTMFVSAKSAGQARLKPIMDWLLRLDDFTRRHERTIFWLLAIAYKFLLDVLYIGVASPMFAYAGLVYQPNFIKYCIGSGMYFILFALFPKREGDTPVCLFHLQFLFTVAPMLSFYALSDNSSRYMLMVFVCILLELWILRRPRRNAATISISGLQSYVTVMLGVLVLFTLVIPPLYNGFAGLKIFDFDYVYEWRSHATYPPLYGYLVNWMFSAVLPFGCIWFLHRRKYLWFALCIAAQLFLYMELGNKIILFILVPVICLYLLARTGHPLKLMYLGFCGICLVVLFAFYLGVFFGSTLCATLCFQVSVRAIFHPADNKFKFFSCFGTLPKTYFSDGQIGRMLGLTYPYGGSLGQVVHCYNGWEFLSANMNTGYLGESYAQMGFAGMVLMSLLFALIVRFLGTYDSKDTTPILASITAVYIVILNDSALFTTLFTSGLLVTILLVFIYFRQKAGGNHGIQR